jgi:hypothetical protein
MKALTFRQRSILAAYCIALTYCVLWVPWRIALPFGEHRFRQARVGYGWLWAGPAHIWRGEFAFPDYPAIVLRIAAASVEASGVLLISGAFRRKHDINTLK